MGMIQPSQHMEDVGGGGVQKSVRQPHRIAQELKRGDANELGVDKNVLSDSKEAEMEEIRLAGSLLARRSKHRRTRGLS
jgi:hypothetical protein